MFEERRVLPTSTMDVLPKYCATRVLYPAAVESALEVDNNPDSVEGFWQRASEVVQIDSGTYVPQEFMPDEILTRMNADRGRPWPIIGRPAPVPEVVDDLLSDPALWQFREEIRVCGHCGEAFGAHTHNQRYCSQRCRRQSSHILCTCTQCGREFRTNRRRQQYCSLSCAGVANRSAANSRQCGQCGRNFRASKAEQRFCSRSCAWAWRKRQNVAAGS